MNPSPPPSLPSLHTSTNNTSPHPTTPPPQLTPNTPPPPSIQTNANKCKKMQTNNQTNKRLDFSFSSPFGGCGGDVQSVFLSTHPPLPSIKHPTPTPQTPLPHPTSPISSHRELYNNDGENTPSRNAAKIFANWHTFWVDFASNHFQIASNQPTTTTTTPSFINTTLSHHSHCTVTITRTIRNYFHVVAFSYVSALQ